MSPILGMLCVRCAIPSRATDSTGCRHFVRANLRGQRVWLHSTGVSAPQPNKAHQGKYKYALAFQVNENSYFWAAILNVR